MHIIQEKILALSKHQDISQIGYRTIGKLVGVSHPQQVKHHLAQLIKKGFIKQTKKNNIVNVIVRPKLMNINLKAIPVYGSANCGTATFIADDKIEGYINISESLLKNKKVIALRAVGNSMNKASINTLSINDGDYVLVDTENKQPRNGDYVLSIIDNCANIKKFIQKDKNQIALISESSEKFEPIYISEADRYFIGGVVTQVIKKAN